MSVDGIEIVSSVAFYTGVEACRSTADGGSAAHARVSLVGENMRRNKYRRVSELDVICTRFVLAYLQRARFHRTHRHEPPVAGGDITIISESPTEIVVDKPCTIPIHPCGSYRCVCVCAPRVPRKCAVG